MHEHSHSCSHGHGHHHAPTNYGSAFLIGITLNVGFVLAEIFYGLQSHSLALLADAGHNASDVLALFLAWGAVVAAKKLPSLRFTYGLQSSSILAALANAMLLFMATGVIIWEAWQRLSNPLPVTGYTVIVVAAIGIIVNGGTALLFMRGNKEDLNIRAAYLHMLSDAAISLGVVVTGLAILKTGWLWLDPVVSIVIAIAIIGGTWGLLRDSVALALHAVPAHVDAKEVKVFLAGQKGVKEVHDLHIWGMSTNASGLSAHLLMPTGHPGDGFIRTLAQELEARFRINHTTLQIEIGDKEGECPLAPDHVV